MGIRQRKVVSGMLLLRTRCLLMLVAIQQKQRNLMYTLDQTTVGRNSVDGTIHREQ